MNHAKVGRKLSRKTGPRKALVKSLVFNLFTKEKIQTTEAKAKEIRAFAERNIEKAKKGGVLANRELMKYFTAKITKKLITEIAPRYKDRKGGYTRIIKLGTRNSDSAKIAIIELVK